jgi:hypothetical protein
LFLKKEKDLLRELRNKGKNYMNNKVEIFSLDKLLNEILQKQGVVAHSSAPCIETQTEEKNMTQKLAGVVCLSNLTKNYYEQFVARNGMTVLHVSEDQAIKEAERLARANPGLEFGTFVLTSISQVQSSVTRKI